MRRAAGSWLGALTAESGPIYPLFDAISDSPVEARREFGQYEASRQLAMRE